MATPSVISVVDDDASVRAALSNLLLSRGYIVHTFGSAEEFLGSLHLTETSCVISGVQVSAMNGLELLVNMRMQGYAAPFIFITAFPDESVRARALEAGAICFLAKPFGAPSPALMPHCGRMLRTCRAVVFRLEPCSQRV